MSFIRPEAMRLLRKWQEVLISIAVFALGLWWASGTGVLSWVGYGLAGIGLGLGFAAIPRARFRTGGQGPGIVSITERRITYFGPLTGGVADLEDMTALRLDPTAAPPHWLLETRGQMPLAIPVNAEGADGLFDAFASLPGMDTSHLVAQMQARPGHPVVIWQRAGAQQDVPRLH